MKTFLPYIPFPFILLSLILIFIAPIKDLPTLQAASADIVISEIQIAGSTANDEFVELYNPTSLPVDLSGWRLSRRSSTSGSTISSLVSSLTGTVAAHGFFLIANPSYTGNNVPDLYYSSTTSGIAANNTVLLYRDNGITLVDKVGMGTAADTETQATAVPDLGMSIERKAVQSATEVSMLPGGMHEFMGNGYDSDSNGNDFILRTTPQPQNTSSTLEPIIVVSPTITTAPTSTPIPTPTTIPDPDPTPSPVVSPTLIPTIPSSPTPTLEPTSTPSPTAEPTNAPTSTPAPSPTVQPSVAPSPTVPIPTPTSTIIPKPTPGIIEYPFPPFKFVCTWKFKSIHLGFGKMLWLPRVHCSVQPV